MKGFDTRLNACWWALKIGLRPRAALTLGLEVDADALPPSVIEAIRHGKVNLDDPAVTLRLIRQNACSA